MVKVRHSGSTRGWLRSWWRCFAEATCPCRKCVFGLSSWFVTYNHTVCAHPPVHFTPPFLHTQAQEAEFGVNFTSPDLENGPTNPLSLKRTFGSSEPIRVKLYRDHAAWCPYCQKVKGG